SDPDVVAGGRGHGHRAHPGMRGLRAAGESGRYGGCDREPGGESGRPPTAGGGGPCRCATVFEGCAGGIDAGRTRVTMRRRWLRVGARYVIVAFVIWITTAYIGSPDRPVGCVGALEAQGDKGFL